MKDELEWREQLKAGDKVVVGGIGYGGKCELAKVVRVTKAQVFVNRGGTSEIPYRKKDGYVVGGSTWHRTYLRKPDPEKLEAIELDMLRNKALRSAERLVIPKDRAGLEAFIGAVTPYVKQG